MPRSPARTPPPVRCEGDVAHDHVGSRLSQQRQRVDVGTADRGPVVIDQRHLGMQERRRGTRRCRRARQQFVVQHAGREAGEAVVELALQQQAHAHAPPAPRHTTRGGTADRGRSTVRPGRCARGPGSAHRCSCARWRGAGAGCRATRNAARTGVRSAPPSSGSGLTRKRRNNERARATGSALLASAMTSSRQSRPKAARVHIARAVCATGAPPGHAAPPRNPARLGVTPWLRSLRSSMMLMPPTNAISVSVASSFWLQATQLTGLQPRIPAIDRAEHRQRDTAAVEPAVQLASVAFEPNPSTTTRTARHAARRRSTHLPSRGQQGRRGRCYVASQTSWWARAMAACMAGNN